MNRLP